MGKHLKQDVSGFLLYEMIAPVSSYRWRIGGMTPFRLTHTLDDPADIFQHMPPIEYQMCLWGLLPLLHAYTHLKDLG